ncbi:UPF0104 family protein [Maritimibacter sp. 55A14]|uniref:lysylphosphatidylglycerol synthase transmembrane domain-containing protein n=1 Tax=Maritimibacter sp. 55A14 TaxID=2174844 RepID=UPI000D619A8A|nr:lysylphosphatidylglycerol synthase transmembrane domain-containing protein [Maritimibacter sp. 55A14]PWE32924.1 UPF0104 family protein [Maritimibacter sp. 55A14]
MFRRYRGLLSTLLLLILFGAGMAGAILSTGWVEAGAGVARLGPGKLALLLALTCGHFAVRAARWHILARAAGLPTGLRQNLRHFFGGFAMTATPGRLGELVRLRWIGRETGWSLERAAPIAFADRAVELAGMVLPIAVAVSFSNLGTGAVWPLLLITAILIWISCRPKLMTRMVETAWRILGRGGRSFVRLRRMTRGMASFTGPGVLLPTTAISVLGWCLEGLAFYLLLSWLGTPIPLSAAIAIFLTAVLSGALSGLPGGLGGTEAACVGLLLLQGVPAETAILATLVIRVTTLWFTVLVGLCVFPLSEMRSRRAAA